MDLTKFLGQDSQEQSAQRLSKEEYAAQKKQEREEIWGMIDGKAQEVFQNGDSLKGFLDFMGQCKPQRTDNLFLLYAQNPEIRQVKTFEKWKEEGKVVKTGSKGYNFIVGQEYEKDGVIQQGYSIQKAYDISQIRTKQPEEAEPKPMDQLMEALLTDSEVRIQIADNLPDKVQAQYIPNKRTIYVRNGMSENATFHSISRELACASLDHHDGSYSRAGVSAVTALSSKSLTQTVKSVVYRLNSSFRRGLWEARIRSFIRFTSLLSQSRPRRAGYPPVQPPEQRQRYTPVQCRAVPHAHRAGWYRPRCPD